MQNQGSNSLPIAPRLEKLELVGSIPLIIKEEIFDKIKFLCRAIKRDEWSGVLFYTVEGSIKQVDTLRITVQDILLMDRGSSAYTEYEWDEDIVNYQMDNPDAIDWIKGHIHSHNTMNVFFSGTDWSELNDNCPNHNIYLSLIVNNFMEMEAKVAFTAAPAVYQCLDEEGKPYDLRLVSDKIKPFMLVYACEVVLPWEEIKVDQGFGQRLEHIQQKSYAKQQAAEAKRKAEAEKAPQKPTGYAPGYGNWNQPAGQPPVFPKATPPTSNKKPTAKSQLELEGFEDWTFDDLASLEEVTKEELFACHVLRLGNSFADDELSEVLDDIEQANLNGDNLRKTIVSDYGIYYANFFESDPSMKSDEAFSECLSQVIILLFQYDGDYAFLGSIIEGLRELENKFDNYLKEDKEDII